MPSDSALGDAGAHPCEKGGLDAVELAKRLPDDRQDEIAAIIATRDGDDSAIVTLSADEDRALAESEAAADQDMFATDDDVQAVWAKYGL